MLIVNSRITALLNLLGFVAVVLINALANILPINGFNTGQVSDIYNNKFVPAGFTFSIWGIIYLALLIFCVFYMLGAFGKGGFAKKITSNFNKVNSAISLLFVLTCLLNILWIICWHYLQIGFCLVIMILFLATLLLIYLRLNKILIHFSNFEKWIWMAPFSLYLGWISVATIANTTTFLTSLRLNPNSWVWYLYSYEWEITYVVVAVAFALGLFMLKKNGDYVFALVVAWALFGILYRWLHTIPYQNVFLAILSSFFGSILGGVLNNIYKKKGYLSA